MIQNIQRNNNKSTTNVYLIRRHVILKNIVIIHKTYLVWNLKLMDKYTTESLKQFNKEYITSQRKTKSTFVYKVILFEGFSLHFFLSVCFKWIFNNESGLYFTYSTRWKKNHKLVYHSFNKSVTRINKAGVENYSALSIIIIHQPIDAIWHHVKKLINSI